jgi:ribosomal-protein-alanine N-acetyltransferase
MLARIKIRPMQPDDVEVVFAIDRISFSSPWSLNAYRYELFHNPKAHLWVAERSYFLKTPQVVGMLVIWLILDEAHIATLAIHPEFRRRGIAKKLLTVGLNEMIGKGAQSAMLEVRASNHPAQILYQDFGFVVVGRRPKYYQDNGEDAILMTASNLDHGDSQRPS